MLGDLQCQCPTKFILVSSIPPSYEKSGAEHCTAANRKESSPLSSFASSCFFLRWTREHQVSTDLRLKLQYFREIIRDVQEESPTHIFENHGIAPNFSKQGCLSTDPWESKCICDSKMPKEAHGSMRKIFKLYKNDYSLPIQPKLKHHERFNSSGVKSASSS